MRLLHPSEDGRFVDLPEMGTVRLRINPDGVFVNDDNFLPWQDQPAMGRTTGRLTLSIGGQPAAIAGTWPPPTSPADKPPAAPDDLSWRCPVCNLYPQRRGCEPGTCRGLVLPWHWDFTRDVFEASLNDATGEWLIGPSNTDGLSVASPYVREVTALAPELEDILRTVVDEYCPTCDLTYHKGLETNAHAPGCRVQSLFARLEAARKKDI